MALMARRVMALLFLLSAPRGFASQQAEVQLRGKRQPEAPAAPRSASRPGPRGKVQRKAEVVPSLKSSRPRPRGKPEAAMGWRPSLQTPAVSPAKWSVPGTKGLPDIAGDVLAAEDVLANINISWSIIQVLFEQANKTAAGVASSAMAKLDSIKPKLNRVQLIAESLGRVPVASANTGTVLRDLVMAFVSHVNASADSSRGIILDAESKGFATIQRTLDEIREVVEAMLLQFREAFVKVADLGVTLAESASQVSPSLIGAPANQGTLHGERFWPFTRRGEPSVWDAAAGGIVKANGTLTILVEKLDSIGASLMYEGLAPVVTAAQGAVADFAMTCNRTIFVLPAQASSQAAAICAAAPAADDLLPDGLGAMETSAAEVGEQAKALCGPVFEMVEALYELVDKAQDADEILNSRVDAAR